MLFQKSTASSLTSSSKSNGPACQPLRGDGVISETTDLTNANRDFNTDATIPNMFLLEDGKIVSGSMATMLVLFSCCNAAVKSSELPRTGATIRLSLPPSTYGRC